MSNREITSLEAEAERLAERLNRFDESLEQGISVDREAYDGAARRLEAVLKRLAEI